MGAMASQITSLTIVYSIVIQALIKENIKAPRHWPLRGEVTGTGEFPSEMASNAENVSIWWRHHGKLSHTISVAVVSVGNDFKWTGSMTRLSLVSKMLLNKQLITIPYVPVLLFRGIIVHLWKWL